MSRYRPLGMEEHVMTAADHQHGSAHGHERFQGASGLVIGAVMLVGRGSLSRLVADLAGAGPGDRVLDVGCGPGSAAREAARRGAEVTGVNPAPMMLRLGRYLSTSRSGRNIVFLPGTAEALPVADRAVTVAWAISSVHHWPDVPAGLRELHRVLAPGGRLIIAERAVPARRPRPRCSRVDRSAGGRNRGRGAGRRLCGCQARDPPGRPADARRRPRPPRRRRPRMRTGGEATGY